MMFFGQPTKVRIVVHVDDLIVAGPEQEVNALREMLGKTINVPTVGQLKDERDHADDLGRELRRVPQGFDVQIGQKLLEMLVRDMNFESCKYIPTPSVKYSEKHHEVSASPFPGGGNIFLRKFGKIDAFGSGLM